MFFYPDWNLTLIIPNGLQNNLQPLIKYLNSKYDLNFQDPKKEYLLEYNLWTSIKDSSYYSLIQKTTKIGFIINPLEKLSLIYNSIQNNQLPSYKNLKKLSFNHFIQFIFQNKELILNENETRLDNLKNIHLFFPSVWLYSEADSIIKNLESPKINILLEYNNYFDKLQDILNKINPKLFSDFSSNFNCQLTGFNSIQDYMVHYNQDLVKLVYLMYHHDFNLLEMPLHNCPKQIIPFQLKYKSKPLITIITPTLGNPSIINLINALEGEAIPYIHLILFDKNRVKNGLKPSDLHNGQNTFCYEFLHPHLLKKENQRNDVWLRAVGVSLANTEYVTFFDDDTWPDRNHLKNIISFMKEKKYGYTFCKRRMWEKTAQNKLNLIGTDNFEAIGIPNKEGYRLIDNSSLYMTIQTARMLIPTYLNNQVYGDDRITPDILDNNAIGGQYNKVVVNHIAKSILVDYFKKNI